MARNSSARGNAQKKTRVSSSKGNMPQKSHSLSQGAAKSKTSGGNLLSDHARHSIASVVLIVLGLVLMLMVCVPTGAVVSHYVGSALRYGLGVCAYVFPLVLIGAGVGMRLKVDDPQVPVRIAIGLVIVFVSLAGLLSLNAPGAEADPGQVFAAGASTSLGGYLGGGIAFAGLNLLGFPVSALLLVGCMVLGAIVVGLSVSRFINRLKAQKMALEESDFELPFARIRRRSNPAANPDALESVSSHARFNGGATSVLPSDESGQNPADSQATQDLATKKNRLNDCDTALLPKDAHNRTHKLGRKKDIDLNAMEGTITQALPASAIRSKGEDQSQSNVTPLAMPRPDDDFQLPSMELLHKSVPAGKKVNNAEFEQMAQDLQDTLEDFGVMASVVGFVAGPTVTLFKVSLPAGVRVNKVTALNDDIALALAAPGVRIFAPIPGTNYVGIEVPNRTRQNVLLGDVLDSAPEGPLQIAIGKDVEGNCIVSNLAKMPHLLIGGTTGSGKSVSINAMIMSILMRATPSEVRFIMIDPKRVEFTPYNGIPHLYVPVVTEPKEASSALAWGVAEMERRLKVFSKVGARNIGQYNAKVQSGEIEEQTGETPLELPYIVIIIDELADLMMNVGKEVEFSISRIAQLARAAGIHLIVATQRPSANVVTGLIKANITNRIAFNVASSIDSRVVLDTPGAESLIGWGDLLLSKPELSKPQRIQGCYVSEDEINKVVELLKSQGEPEYHSEILKTNVITLADSSPDGSGGGSTSDDPLIWEAAEIVVSSGQGSTSYLQRRLKVGYARAGRIMDMLEEKGIVGPGNGSKPRDVLVDSLELESLKALEAHD